MFKNRKNYKNQFSHLIISLKLTFVVSINIFGHFLKIYGVVCLTRLGFKDNTLEKDNFPDLAHL